MYNIGPELTITITIVKTNTTSKLVNTVSKILLIIIVYTLKPVSIISKKKK